MLHERPMHPYEMQQLMRQRRADARVKIRAGSLYHTVERLEAGEDIEIVDTQREGRRPERTVYGLTDRGRDAFADRVREMLTAPVQEYPQYPVALSAANDLDRADVVEALAVRVVDLEANVAGEQAVIEKFREMNLPEAYWMDVDYQHQIRRTELAWTKKLLRRLESGDLGWPQEDDGRAQLSVAEQLRGTA